MTYRRSYVIFRAISLLDPGGFGGSEWGGLGQVQVEKWDETGVSPLPVNFCFIPRTTIGYDQGKPQH